MWLSPDRARVGCIFIRHLGQTIGELFPTTPRAITLGRKLDD